MAKGLDSLEIIKIIGWAIFLKRENGKKLKLNKEALVLYIIKSVRIFLNDD